jgi:hypothetical protein
VPRSPSIMVEITAASAQVTLSTFTQLIYYCRASVGILSRKTC